MNPPRPNPGSIPRLAAADGSWTVFLSSTIDDFATLRKEVEAALRLKAETSCFLSEDWVGAYEDVEAKCLRKLREAHGYVLMVGHWYGSVPPAGTRSITHLEFEWAIEHWKDGKPPKIAVMMPKVNSAADLALRQSAADIVADRHLDAAAHAARLDEFHRRVTGSWKTVTWFNDAHDLRENAIVICMRWRSGSFTDAARGAAELPDAAVSTIDDASLGMLGRARQLEAMKRALGALAVGPNPALALLVYGDADAGQRVFLAHLVSKPLRPFRPKNRGGRLTHQCVDVEALCAWIAQSLGLAESGLHTPEGVAERAAGELRRRSLCLLLDGVGAFPGGVAAFHAEFWQPFSDRLAELHGEQSIANRLVAVISDYSADASAWAAVVRNPDADDDPAPADLSLLLALPRLGRFTPAQVWQWLTDMEVVDDPPGRLTKLADQLLRNDRGEPDRVPLRVLERLRGETL